MQATIKTPIERLDAALRAMSDYNAGRLTGFGMALAELGAAPRDRQTQARALGIREERRP